jgi:hypothetical protein
MTKTILRYFGTLIAASGQFHAANSCAQYTTLPKMSGTDPPPLPAHARYDHRRAVPDLSTAGLVVHFMRLVDSGYATPPVIRAAADS